jgi:glycosyltransferase involved in cell wall biosynthesis
MSPIPIRIGLEQRLFPAYRKPFFEMVAKDCPEGFNLFAGKSLEKEGIIHAVELTQGKWVKADTQYFVVGKQIIYRQRNLMDWLKVWQPKVLIVEANPRHLGLSEAMEWMHGQGGKVIGWGLGVGSSQGIIAKISNPRRLKMVRGFDAIISYSQRGKQDFMADGIDGERVFVAPNAVVPRPESKPQKRHTNDRNYQAQVLFVGRLLPRKRVDVLIQASARLSPGIQPELIIVGDGPERNVLEKQARNEYRNTRFTGDLRGNALEEAYRQSDLFVLPGTGGLAVQQAMSHGLPVITGVGDGTQLDLVRPENGWQLKTDGVEELAQVMENALKDVKKLRKMGEASFDIVKKEVNLNAMLNVFEIAIQYVLEH